MTAPSAAVQVTPQEFDDAGRTIVGFQDRAEGIATGAAIDNSPDPRLTQADMSRVGDGLGKGSIDESARKFFPEERPLADRLAAEGKNVRSLAEDAKSSRQPDAEVDGVPTEFKQLDPTSAGTSSSIRNVLGRSKKDGGQARDIVIDGSSTSLDAQEALRGIARFENARPGHYDSITIYLRDGVVRWP